MNENIDRDLIALPLPQDALAVFTTPGAIDPYLHRVRTAIDAFEADATTDFGRKMIKSMAHKISKAKTALEAEGKRLADEQKKIPKLIDATRKQINDTLDAWRDEVRKPVDDFEAEEEAREAAIKAEIARVQAEKFEAEQAELNALRAEKVERARLDHEADIRASAAREATARAEASAKSEKEAYAARERQLVADREAAEQRAIASAQKAILEIEQRAEHDRAQAAEREANKKHRAAIHNEALAALVASGLDEGMSKAVITLIASRGVPHVTISY